MFLDQKNEDLIVHPHIPLARMACRSYMCLTQRPSLASHARRGMRSREKSAVMRGKMSTARRPTRMLALESGGSTMHGGERRSWGGAEKANSSDAEHPSK